MRFDWDDRRAASNYNKHGVLFETAAEIFSDPHLILLPDRVVEGEERWQAVGIAASCWLLTVVHTAQDPDGDLVVRIISARKATRHERRAYEEED
jgi:uncharacterized protein